MIIYFVFITIIITFEYFINPFGFFGLYSPKASYYLIFTIAVSSLEMIITIVSFISLKNSIQDYQPDVFESIQKDLYNTFLWLIVIDMCNIASHSVFLEDNSSS